jgi:hypothetical protein
MLVTLGREYAQDSKKSSFATLLIMNNNYSTENNFVQKQIKRADRNILITNISLLLIPASIFTLGAKYWYNFALGPFPMTTAEIQQIKDPEQSWKYFVTVSGDKSIKTGFEEITTRKRKGVVVSSDVSAKVVALTMERRILLVKAYPKDEQATTFTGYLTPIPSQIQTGLIGDPAVQKYKDVFFPFLLTADLDFRGLGYFGLGIGSICLGIGGWNVFNVFKRQGKLEFHPLWKKLAKFGDPETITAEVNSQIANDSNQFHANKSITITRSWLIRKTTYNLDLFSLEQIAWIYQKVTQHRRNGVPVGKTYAAVMIGQNGEALEIPAKEAEVMKILAEIIQRIPWVVVGYSDEIRNLWQKDRTSFLAILQQRREEANNANQN